MASQSCLSVIHRKVTRLGFVSGILAGLVVISPAAGVVKPYGALILGAVSSAVCYYALVATTRFGYDDSLDCFGSHGVGSGTGVLLPAFFIRESRMRDAAAASATKSWGAVFQFMAQAWDSGPRFFSPRFSPLGFALWKPRWAGWITPSTESADTD
jgi:Amt family ammonium transporter